MVEDKSAEKKEGGIKKEGKIIKNGRVEKFEKQPSKEESTHSSGAKVKNE